MVWLLSWFHCVTNSTKAPFYLDVSSHSIAPRLPVGVKPTASKHLWGPTGVCKSPQWATPKGDGGRRRVRGGATRRGPSAGGDAAQRVTHSCCRGGHGGAAQARSEPVLLFLLLALVTCFLVLLPITWMFTNRVIVAVVYHSELPQCITSYCSLDRPVVAIVRLRLTI